MIYSPARPKASGSGDSLSFRAGLTAGIKPAARGARKGSGLNVCATGRMCELWPTRLKSLLLPLEPSDSTP